MLKGLHTLLGDRIEERRYIALDLSRDSVRNLNALDLPQDIWYIIFKILCPQLMAKDGTLPWRHVWATTGEDWSHKSAPVASCADPGLHAIRTMRLVCRTFNEIASPHMCPILNINADPTSLENTEQLCRNSLIMQGVYCVQVWVQSYYIKFASNKRGWARSRLRQLRRAVPQEVLDDEATAQRWWNQTTIRGYTNSILAGEPTIDVAVANEAVK
ncbi:hypothetical protein LIA77_03114 [Sarocladium implicatum]|nr:hypothetical protein LIA77_03114 [Sarocladium implicatum]